MQNAGQGAAVVAITIKTFERPLSLMQTLRSIQEHCNVPYRLYIADDGEVSPEVEAIYGALRQQGHVVVQHPVWTSVTAARNDLVNRMAEEEYVLRLDDDFNFTAETDLSAMLRIMEVRPEIGAVAGVERQSGKGKGTASGEISAKQGHISIDNGTLIRTNVPPPAWTYMMAQGVRFAFAHFTRNFLLIRREVFKSVRWDEDLYIQGEHLTFMLDLQRAGWLLAFTPESVHLHDEVGEDPPGSYDAFRHSQEGLARRDEIFRRKFGIVSEGREILISAQGQRRKSRAGVLVTAKGMFRRFLALSNG